MKTKKPHKTKICQKCNQEFLNYPKVNGKWLDCNKRLLCLDCLPYRQPRPKKTNTCKQCFKEFRQFIRINGKSLNLSRRSFCLECSPFGEYKFNKKPIINGERECSRCKQFKPLIEFRKYKTSGKVCGNCNPCERQRLTEYGHILKQKSIDYLGSKCSICGYNRCMRSLVFHHKDPAQKEFSLAKRKCLNWEDTCKELDKCVLLCANCHGEVHDSP